MVVVVLPVVLLEPTVPGRTWWVGTVVVVWLLPVVVVVVLVHTLLSNAPIPMYWALVKFKVTGFCVAKASFWAIKALLNAASPM